MSKKSVCILIIFIISSLLAVFSASADFTATGSVDENSGCVVDRGTWFYGEIQSFTASATGSYTFIYLTHTWDDTAWFGVVPGSYNPNVSLYDQAVGYLTSWDTPMLVTSLTAGQSYSVIAAVDQGYGSKDECVSRVRSHVGDYSYIVDEPVGTDPVAGCDMRITLPDTAVVGAITDYAPVYWKPGAMTGPAIVLDPGKTYWMDGIDETGMYRHILIGCEWLWVETGDAGPNYDAVWNGTPLPAHTVDS